MVGVGDGVAVVLLDDAIENVVVREAVPDVCSELTLLEAMTLAEAGDPEYMKVHIQGRL